MKKFSFTECPSGHTLPKDGCTPLYCGSSAKKPRAPQLPDPQTVKYAKQGASQRKGAKKKAASVDGVVARAQEEMLQTIEGTVELNALEAVVDEDFTKKAADRLAKRVKEKAMRMALLKVPKDLNGADAEEWADRKAVELLPAALAEIEYQLYYGDDAQRREAARDVLDMTGRRRREVGGNMAPTIVLNMPGYAPWEKVVNAEVTVGAPARVEAGKDAAAGNGPDRPAQVDGGRGPTSG